MPRVLRKMPVVHSRETHWPRPLGVAAGVAVSSELISTLARGIANGEYSLLVGAGATAGAEGGDGQPLPTGPELRRELVQRFQLGASAEQAPLQRVFSAAAKKDPEALAELLVARFTRTTPTWQRRLAEFPWERVWTLNIDDVLEQVFSAHDRSFASLTFRSSSARRQRRGDLEIVHLHGAAEELLSRLEDVSAAEALNTIIFDWSQYAQAVRSEPVWHQRFIDDFIDTPFLVIGATIVDEVDFWRIFSRPSSAGELWGTPTVSVLRDISDFDRSQLESELNVAVEIGDGADFTDRLLAEYRKVVREEEGFRHESPTPEEQRFLTQFINLRQYKPHPRISSGTFYDGWEPDWSTITSEMDVPFSVTEEVASNAIETATSDIPRQKMHLVSGAPGTGKSTALLRIAERARRAGLTPWLFRGDEVPDSTSLVAWAHTHPQSAYFFDDCADFSGAIGDSLEQASERGVALTVVGTTRVNRFDYTVSRLPSDLTTADTHLPVGALTDEDIQALIEKLESVGRLGRITRLSDDRRTQYFRLEHGRQLFPAMAALETGEGFVDRVVRTYRDLKDEPVRLLVSAVSLAHNYGVALRLSAASQISGIDPASLKQLVRLELSGIVFGDRTGLRMSHRVTASLFLQHALKAEERFNIGVAVARVLGAHIDRASIAQMSREHRLSRQILRHENVLWLVGADRGRDFYEAVAPEYSWNGRFWDQRALFEMRLGDLGRARSYAERSVDEHRHPYAFTTLGRVLMSVAEQSGSLDDVRDAIAALDEARGASRPWRHWQPDEYPYTAFFTGLLAFADAHGFSALDLPTRQAWVRWMSNARQSGIVGVHEAIRDWEVEWSRLSAPSS